jgi:phage-related minor tail protein
MRPDELETQLAALESRLAASADMIAAFDGELAQMGRTLIFTGRETERLSASLGGGLRRAFDGVVFDGARLSDALRGVARTMVASVYDIAMRPVQDALGGALARGLSGAMSSLLPFGQGAGFAQGRVMPFADGGIVNAPTLFPMRGGTGLMGEAGPEAIMPLARGADGKLGVRGSGGGRPVQVTFNIQTPDVAGFQRSQGQIAAQMSRLLAHGQRYS